MGLFDKLKGKVEQKLQELNINERPGYQQPIYNPGYQQPVYQNGPPAVPQRDYYNSNYSNGGNSDVNNYNNNNSRDRVKSVQSQGNLGDGNVDDLFGDPISSDAPVQQIKSSGTHPVPLPEFYQQKGPIETNNFYGNMLVEKQNLPVWTHPYSLWKCDDDQFWGLAVSCAMANQRVFGDDPNSNPCKYFFSPVGICSISLGASEFQQGIRFRVGECKRFSCGVEFTAANARDSGAKMTSKLVQGMGLITALYTGNIHPRITSKVGFQTLGPKGRTTNGLNKFILTLFDSSKWVLFSSVDSFVLRNANCIESSSQLSQSGAIIQVGRVPKNGDENAYDSAAGAYVEDMTLSGSVDDRNTAQYCFNYKIAGKSSSGKVVQWALPHQYRSADQCMSNERITNAELDSTCKGAMQAYLTSRFVMNEQLPPQELQYDPYIEGKGCPGYSAQAIERIREVARQEIDSFDVVNVSNTDSMYTSGKILDKGAFMLYVAGFVLKDEQLAQKQLVKMKQAFERFIENRQQAPLVYNSTWKGVVSSAGLQDGNFYSDFGNCFFNDHHFHYGYHIHAASLVALADQKFGDNTFLSKSKDWVNTLARDICNPSERDQYFPVLRSFDFFHGHSFANGLFAHGDGKDEESSSEDYHCYYGVKLWGRVTGNKQLEQLGSLILAIERRAMNLYMLYSSDNDVVPSNFRGNKVSGILFENKIDHATYFGMNKEYIHGIHMIPVTPISNYMRKTRFVKEEWDQIRLGDLARSIDSGWKGLLYLNSAVIHPKEAWNFFNDVNFQDRWLDNGMSRTWSLAYCAGMGGR